MLFHHAGKAFALSQPGRRKCGEHFTQTIRDRGITLCDGFFVLGLFLNDLDDTPQRHQRLYVYGVPASPELSGQRRHVFQHVPVHFQRGRFLGALQRQIDRQVPAGKFVGGVFPRLCFNMIKTVRQAKTQIQTL